jgi:hypothetical protein
MKIIKIVLPLVLFFIIAANINAQDRIKFKKGEISAVVEDGIARGETHSYLVGASRDQYMVVTIMSIEDNGVFQILNKRTGEYLPGAEETTDAKRWEGYLPSTGDYKITVGSIRGGSEYTLKVSIE